MADKYKILVVGHPRSATRFMSRLLQVFGMDVDHEKFGKDGISSWYLSPEKERKCEFENIIAVMRDPWKIVVSSAHNLQWSTVDIRRKNCKFKVTKNIYETSARSVLCWYDMILKQNPGLIVKPETVGENLFNFLVERKLIPKSKYGDTKWSFPSNNLNQKRHSHLTRLVTWDHAWKYLPGDLYNRVKELKEYHGKIV